MQGNGWKIKRSEEGATTLHIKGWPDFSVDHNKMVITLPPGFVEELQSFLSRDKPTVGATGRAS